MRIAFLGKQQHGGGAVSSIIHWQEELDRSRPLQTRRKPAQFNFTS
jgi:hypothetical protein